jgi:hypothetical protein
MLYELDALVKPNWFGVAVPEGITDFSRPTIYFHPNPPPAKYVEGPNSQTYFGKSDPDAPNLSDLERERRRTWWHIFEYVDRLGAQLAGAVQFGATPNQVLILPFMPGSANGTAGIMPTDWLPIVTDILGDVRQRIAGIGGAVTVSDVAVAGFSFGHTIGLTFRNRARQQVPDLLTARLKQVWAFDGEPNMADLAALPALVLPIRYDAANVTNTQLKTVHVPLSRWVNYPAALPEEEPGLFPQNDTHHNIRDFMFLDAAMKRDLTP